jgi:hypothetical protein
MRSVFWRPTRSSVHRLLLIDESLLLLLLLLQELGVVVGSISWMSIFFLSVAGVIQGKRNEWVATNTVLKQLFCEEEEEEVGN